MARKKTKGSFQHNPFRNLKGFAVSPPGKASGSERKPEEEAAGSSPESSDDDEAAFVAEMERLGVQGEAGTEDEPPDREQKTPEDADPAPADSDEALFLAALSGMDTRFEDGAPSAEEQQAAPRRMKQLRQGRLVPEETVDLHGLSRSEVRIRVGYFLDNAVYHGLKTVLIITGRGRGSGGEPVLRTEVERFLAEEGRTRVSEWGRAPRRYGGEGALVVFLKSAVKS